MRMPRVGLATATLLVASTACGLSASGEDADVERSDETMTIAGTGSPTGGCQDEVTNAAGGHVHVDPGTEMQYTGVPPVSGNHWATYPEISKMVYLAEERPDLGQLVHAQEHGWTIIWYDETIAGRREMGGLADAAAAVEDAGVPKVVFMPWTADDGDAFPEGAHIAMTHWGNTDDGVEYRQFCERPDPDAILAFAERHPYTDSREPNAP